MSSSLPDEMLVCVFAHLDARGLTVAALVCGAWSRVTRDESLWRRHALAAGWPSADNRHAPPPPPCGWRTAARRMAAGTVLVLYAGTNGGRALTSVTSVAVRARRTLSQAMAAIDTAIGRKSFARRRDVFVPAHADVGPSDAVNGSMHRWQEAPPPSVPLAAIDAVGWSDDLGSAGTVRGTLRVSDSPFVRASPVRPSDPSVWLITCDTDADGSGSAALLLPPIGFVHVVDQAVGRNGAWLDHGHGTMLCRGVPYEGEWCRGRPEGFGIRICREDGRYAGRWRNGRRYGQGRHDGNDGTGYRGRWVRDVPHGYGRRWYPDGRAYEGTFSNGVQHGPGVIVSPGGMRMPVVWRMGALESVLPIPAMGETPARAW